MNDDLALVLTPAPGKDYLSSGGPLGIFVHDRPKFLLDVRLQARADIDLFSADPVLHWSSCVPWLRQHA